MTDIVVKLRSPECVLDGELPHEAADEIERLQAARHADSQRILKMSDEYEATQDEITRLRADNERLQAVLILIREGCGDPCGVADSALTGRETDPDEHMGFFLLRPGEGIAEVLERQAAEIERLRAALKKIVDLQDRSFVSDAGLFSRAVTTARKALTGREDPPEKDVTSIVGMQQGAQ